MSFVLLMMCHRFGNVCVGICGMGKNRKDFVLCTPSMLLLGHCSWRFVHIPTADVSEGYCS